MALEDAHPRRIPYILWNVLAIRLFRHGKSGDVKKNMMKSAPRGKLQLKTGIRSLSVFFQSSHRFPFVFE